MEAALAGSGSPVAVEWGQTVGVRRKAGDIGVIHRRSELP